MPKDIGQRQYTQCYFPMYWRPLQDKLMSSSLMMMGLLPWRILQTQQQTLLLKSPHMCLSSLCLGYIIERQNSYDNQVGTPIMFRYLSLFLAISYRISSYGSKLSNWLWLTSISCGVWWWIFYSLMHERRHNNSKLDRSCSTYLKKRCTR